MEDKNHLKICPGGASGGYFHTSLHNRSTRNIFHFSLSRQSIYKGAKGFGHARVSGAQPALGAHACIAPPSTPAATQTVCCSTFQLLAANFCHHSCEPNSPTLTCVCTDVSARGPFIKMPSAHSGAAHLNFNLFC